MTNHQKSMQELQQESYLAGNESYLENLYEQYLINPEEIDPQWRKYFDNLNIAIGSKVEDVSHAAIREQFLKIARNNARNVVVRGLETKQDQQQEKVIELITAFRRLGHLRANIDPLNLQTQQGNGNLFIDYYGFTNNDLDKKFNVSTFSALNKSEATLKEIDAALKRVYCNTIGFEYMHINRSDEVEWIRDRIENGWAHFKPTNEEKQRILDRLIAADGLEKYLGFKYVGQKRFSLEGGDTLIPLLDTIVNRGAKSGVNEIVIGMAHRGRLNVLVNVVGKPPGEIFDAFEGKGVSDTHSGDVKYHLGSSSDVATPYGDVHIALAFNPSHLEIVSPVVQGSVRARQRRRRDGDQLRVVPIQIHGDAAFAGQGVVMETFNMSQARWFKVGGSIHIVINNQVGFTISNPCDARSTIYCTDIAKMVEAPILHVNGNDPEAVYFAAMFAIDYRQTFKRDVVIDLVCYRRHGHNEADEPSATQPVMYKIIKAMPVPYLLYAKKLVEEGVIEKDAEKKLVENYRNALDQKNPVVKLAENNLSQQIKNNWEQFIGKSWLEKVNTGVPIKKLKSLAAELEKLPNGFVVQTQVKKSLDAQKKMAQEEMPLNWGFAENLAYASLLDEGYAIRLCGQDSGRGTFAHRHAILYNQENGEYYIPLNHISEKQAKINIVDSLLSEEAVLAFEYGYATTEPNYLDIWEAQFGDFANGAQVVIDQFISSGEQKWGRLCGLVMLLPHGYEGQGPEHSSARLERYLQLCAQDNMQVCMPSTPAQIFHLLRRQMIRPYRKPLIVMTPKSLLRNPLAVSDLTELSEGSYQLMIPEIDDLDAKKIERVIFCAGKVYYELLQKRRAQEIKNTAIIRIEQFYPFPDAACQKIFEAYPNAKQIVWCQEEPQNQGAWMMIKEYLVEFLLPGQQLLYAGRMSSASPAAGYHAVHEKQQEELVTQALAIK